MKQFIFVKRLLIDALGICTNIEQRAIPVNKIDSVIETTIKIDFFKLDIVSQMKYTKEIISNSRVSKIILKENDKELKSDIIYVLGDPESICQNLNS